MGPRLVPLRATAFVVVVVVVVVVNVVVAIASAAATAALRLVVSCFFMTLAALNEITTPPRGGERRL